ncbi:MAG: CoA transferase [Chloroflexi bacterium]|nr:CoA transferase [Chloroflexota bacterium]
MPIGALSHVKAVEYCTTPSGSYCAKLIADMGAEVVKIEEPGHGDPCRRYGEFLSDIPDHECSARFLYLNTNKFGVTLNVRSATGRKVFERLCESADMLIEDTRPGTLDELGIGYQSLRALNPSLVMTSITPFGQSGPYKDFKAYGINSYHAAGDAFVLQSSGVSLNLEEPPVAAGRFAGDFEVGTIAAVALLAALYGRASLGAGEYIDVSRQEALMQLNGNILIKYANCQTIPTRATQSYDYGGMMPCKDGYIVIQAVEEHHWQGLVEVMDNPEWAKEDRFKDKFARVANKHDLNLLLAQWLIQHTREEIAARARERGVPVGPVLSIEEVAGYRQYNERGFFVELDHPRVGRRNYPRGACLSTEPFWSPRRGAPLLGEHNELVYGKMLGYENEELVAMRQAGII